jgi:hypothetical protein
MDWWQQLMMGVLILFLWHYIQKALSMVERPISFSLRKTFSKLAADSTARWTAAYYGFICIFTVEGGVATLKWAIEGHWIPGATNPAAFVFGIGLGLMLRRFGISSNTQPTDGQLYAESVEEVLYLALFLGLAWRGSVLAADYVLLAASTKAPLVPPKVVGLVVGLGLFIGSYLVWERIARHWASMQRRVFVWFLVAFYGLYYLVWTFSSI